MTQTLTVRVGADGVLTLPLGQTFSNQLALVTVQTIPEVTQEKHSRFIENTAGKWEGGLERHPQGEYEEREPL